MPFEKVRANKVTPIKALREAFGVQFNPNGSIDIKAGMASDKVQSDVVKHLNEIVAAPLTGRLPAEGDAASFFEELLRDLAGVEIKVKLAGMSMSPEGKSQTPQEIEAQSQAVVLAQLRRLTEGQPGLLEPLRRVMNGALKAIEETIATAVYRSFCPLACRASFLRAPSAKASTSAATGGLLVRIDYDIRGAKEFAPVGGGKTAKLLLGFDRAHFTYQVSIKPDDTQKVDKPLWVQYEAELGDAPPESWLAF